jgi:hypothetical protein
MTQDLSGFKLELFGYRLSWDVTVWCIAVTVSHIHVCVLGTSCGPSNSAPTAFGFMGSIIDSICGLNQYEEWQSSCISSLCAAITK